MNNKIIFYYREDDLDSKIMKLRLEALNLLKETRMEKTRSGFKLLKRGETDDEINNPLERTRRIREFFRGS